MLGEAFGPLVLFLEGVVFFMLHEPDWVPNKLLRMVDTNLQPSDLKKYLTMSLRLWGTHIAGPILAGISLVLIIVSAVFINNPTISARIIKSGALIAGLAAALLMFKAQYDVWHQTNAELRKEKSKNESAPKISISALNVVPRGSLNSGLTDLFVNLDLVLESPSHVCIRDFSLMIFNESNSKIIAAVEDIPGWRVEKWGRDDSLSYIPCVPLAKELTQRGDPVQGWIHFPLPGISERSIQDCGLKVKLNCEHGTCYYNLDVAYVQPDRSRGFMRRNPYHET